MTRDRDDNREWRDEQSIEEAGVWIRDTLGRRPGGFYHLGYSSARPAHWRSREELEDPRHLEEFRLVAEGLGAHGRGGGGLVVLVTDDQNNGRSRCYLAYQIARLLGESGAEVLLVDGELEQEGPGDWLGEPGREGLLDLTRYGASPRACVQRTTMANVQLMGVGSYRPDSGEVLEAEEVEATLRQLRAGWDIVLCTAPAHYADGRFNPLFHHGDGALMGVTLRGEARDRFEELAEYFLDQGVAIFGVMAFAETGLEEEPELRPEPAVSVEPEPRPEAVVSEEPEAARWEPEQPSRGVSPYSEMTRRAPHRSSRVFRAVAFGILIALAVFVGLWFGIQWLQRPASVDLAPLEQERELGEPVAQLAPSESGSMGQEDTQEETGAASTEPVQTEEEVRSRIAATTEPESGTLEAEDAVEPGADVRAGTVETENPPEEESPAQAPVTLPEPAEVSAEPVETPAAADPLRAAMLLEPSSGYALHLWSFPDSLQAIPSVQKLRKEGFRPVVRRAEIKGKGTWYRVLIGNYATRRQALDARELLSDRPDIDYVGVLRAGG